MRIVEFVAILFLTNAANAHELVLNHDFPDPVVIKAADGQYYAYATQGFTETQTPQLINFQIATSTDLKTWTYIGEALPKKPSWAKQGQSFWAPHVHVANNQYYFFYSAERDGEADEKCLAVAVSKSPRGPFADSGRPLLCGSGYENIDPMLFVDPQSKKPYLFWGSMKKPIRAQELDPSLLKFASGSKRIEIASPQDGPNADPFTRLFEGAWVLKRNGFFFLFVSGEDCCNGTSPTYAVLVLRSKNLFGPYEYRNKDAKQSVFVLGNERFRGTGHNSFINDSNGTLWSFYHGVDQQYSLLKTLIPFDRQNRRVLLRDRVEFKNGWPRTSTSNWK